MNLAETRRSWQHPEPSAGRRAPVPHRTTSVLVIDDDPADLELMWRRLTAAGCRVLTATRGTTGLQLLQHQATPVDVIVVHDAMPDLTGAQIAAVVRQLAPGAKIIGVARTDRAALPRDPPHGVDRLLHKPVTTTALLSTIHALVRRAAGPTAAPAGAQPASFTPPRERCARGADHSNRCGSPHQRLARRPP